MAESKTISVTHRGITAEHYREGKKYMLWYHKAGSYSYENTIGFVQVRGLTDYLTEDEIRAHIDKLWERYYESHKTDRKTEEEREI